MKLSSLILHFFLSTVTPLVSAFSFSSATSNHHHPWTTTKSTSSSTILYLQRSVQDAIVEAERICAIDPSSNECKVAWDIVEELEAADSHRGAAATSTISDAM